MVGQLVSCGMYKENAELKFICITIELLVALWWREYIFRAFTYAVYLQRDTTIFVVAWGTRQGPLVSGWRMATETGCRKISEVKLQL